MAQIDERLPLYQRLRDDLAAKVAEQVWRPGDVLPSERDLAARYAVAPGTMRKAIETLVAEGLLERRQGRGTFVRRADFATSLFRFFRHVKASGQPIVPRSEILQRREQRAGKTVAAKLGIAASDQVIHLKRRRLIDSKALVSEEIWLPKAIFAPLLDIPIEDFGDLLYPLYERACQRSIARADEHLSVGQADKLRAEHLGVKVGDPVVVVERVAFGFNGQILEWRRSHGSARHFHYHIEIR